MMQLSTSSGLGVCYASFTAGPSQPSAPIVGVNATGVSPRQTPGPPSLSPGEAGAPASWTCLPCDLGYDIKFKVDETPLGYRLIAWARVPLAAPKREVPISSGGLGVPPPPPPVALAFGSRASASATTNQFRPLAYAPTPVTAPTAPTEGDFDESDDLDQCCQCNEIVHRSCS